MNKWLILLIKPWSVCMQNNNPKSEMPAMKERAAKDKDKQARNKSIEREKAGHADGIAIPTKRSPHAAD
jgi:hypothetical protein